MPGKDCGSHEFLWIAAARSALKEARCRCVSGGCRSAGWIVGHRDAIADYECRERRFGNHNDGILVVRVNETTIRNRCELASDLELTPER
jgi:hypothetical protein